MKPRPHQTKAINASVKELKAHNRCKVIMPCGTGKTLVGLHVAKRLKSRRTLVAVPSLELSRQLWGSYKGEFSHSRFLIACHDKNLIGDIDEQFADIPKENRPRITTDHAEVATFLRQRSDLIVISTYQSSPRLAEAFAMGRIQKFDLAVFDEAHNMAGKDGVFATALDDSRIPISKRLFMTATPKVASKKMVAKSAGEALPMVCMNDESLFGRDSHKLSFTDAIEGNLLTDYQVSVFVVKESELHRLIQEHDDIREAAKSVALIRAAAKHDLRKMIVYHNRVAGMKRFNSLTLPAAFEAAKESGAIEGRLHSFAISAKDGSGKRREMFDEFKSLNGDSWAFFNNCKTLQEGVDFPFVDGICMIDPRLSSIDIVQCVGRAIRNSPGKKIATVAICVLMPDGAENDPASFVASSEFASVWDTLVALKSHDERVGSWINGLREGGRSITDHIQVDVDLPVRMSKRLIAAIDERTIGSMMDYEPITREAVIREMKKHFDEYGEWPSQTTSGITKFGITWKALNNHFVLCQLRKELNHEERITKRAVVREMTKYFEKHGKYPCCGTKSQTVFGISWIGVDRHFNLCLLKKEQVKAEIISENAVIREMRSFFKRTGKFPNGTMKQKTVFGMAWSGVNKHLNLYNLRKRILGLEELEMRSVVREMKTFFNESGRWPNSATKASTVFGLKWLGVNKHYNLSALRKRIERGDL